MIRRAIFLFLCICAAFLAVARGHVWLIRATTEKFERRHVMPDQRGSRESGGIPIRNDRFGEGHFGAKRRGGRKHLGIDIKAAIATPVMASKSGFARPYCVPHGYGNLVIIIHPSGDETRYGHLDTVGIKGFGWVMRGEIIGTVGKTGNADTPGLDAHLHYEIRRGGTPIDPEPEIAD